MNDYRKVSQDIKDKFGSISRFADLSKIDYNELRKTFARFAKGMNKEKEKELNKIVIAIKATDPSKQSSNELTDKDRSRLKAAIEKAGGVYSFCDVNKNFSPPSVWQILDGSRKRKTTMVKDLFTTLKIN